MSSEPVRIDAIPSSGGASTVSERGTAEVGQMGRGPAQADSAVSATRSEALMDFSDYFPKAYLSINPAPLASVEILPPDIAGRETVRLELSVYIDEFGKVRRVRPETPGVEEPYVEAAARAFEATPFKPGEINGRAVKSVIKVVVEFQQL